MGVTYVGVGKDEDVQKIKWRPCDRLGDHVPLPILTRKGKGRKRSLEHMSQTMENAWKQRKFTDAEVLCGGVRIPVHRCTLAGVSPVFEAAFSSQMQEGAGAVYEIQDSTPEAVEAMLVLIYTGALPPVELLPQVFELTVKYELETLAGACATKMAEEVSVNNVKAVFAVLKLHSATVAFAKTAFAAVVRKVKDAETDDLLIAIG
jgi:hypothetical protein